MKLGQPQAELVGDSRMKGMPVRTSGAGLCVALLFSLAGPASLQGQMSEQVLSRYWAPVLVQDLDDGLSHRSDYLTSVDFDDNWRLDNNPTNAVAYAMPSVVYNWWHRTENYVLLGYSFYRIEGAGWAQNDLRSVVVLLTRPSRERPTGSFLGLALQQGAAWKFAAEMEGLFAASSGKKSRGQGRSQKGGRGSGRAFSLDWRSFSHQITALGPTVEDIQDVDFIRTADGLHPVLYGTKETHELATKVDVANRPALFELNAVTDWSDRRPMMEAQGRAHSTYASGRASDYMPLAFGLIYAPGAGESLVAPPGQMARGKLSHHWEVFSYGLRSIDVLWDRRKPRNEKEAKLPFFDALGRLVGEGKRGPGSLPPWLSQEEGVTDEGEKVLAISASSVFFDGTSAFSRVFDVAEEAIQESSLDSAQGLADAAAEFGR